MSIKDPPSLLSLLPLRNVLYLALVRFDERESTVYLHSPSPRYIYISLRHSTAVIVIIIVIVRTSWSEPRHSERHRYTTLCPPISTECQSQSQSQLFHVTVTVPVIATVTVNSRHEIHHVTTCRTTGSGPSNPGNLADIESI